MTGSGITSEAPPIGESVQDTFSPTSPAAPSTVAVNNKKKDLVKVIVHFQAIGNAPILKQKMYKITASNKFMAVITFLRKEINYGDSDPLFLYVNRAFSPSPDEVVQNLFKSSMSSDGEQDVNDAYGIHITLETATKVTQDRQYSAKTLKSYKGHIDREKKYASEFPNLSDVFNMFNSPTPVMHRAFVSFQYQENKLT
ncbi:hypothetical protein BGZ46_000527 [Entomortierella lignicola]|nr:hypothetical protein BGZ46_000527 [Entomortierella lignicola]